MEYVVKEVAYKDNDKRNGIIAIKAENILSFWNTVETQSKEEAINNIETGSKYYTDYEKNTPVNIVNAEDGKYLRTDANDTSEDNLGELPTFIYNKN